MEKSDTKNDLRSGSLSWAIKGVTYKAYVAAVLMFAAGSWKWIAGWVYVIILLLIDLATVIVVFPRSPELLIERSSGHSDAKTWDKKIMHLAASILPLISWIMAGLDLRLGWNPPVSREFQLLAGFVTIFGHGIIVWAMGANAFFHPWFGFKKRGGILLRRVVLPGHPAPRVSGRNALFNFCAPDARILVGRDLWPGFGNFIYCANLA